VNGFWAQNEDQWENHLLKLIKEERLRREMGLQGRKTVEKDYCLDVNAPRLVSILNEVMGKRKQ
jgi:hypothetical protein